MRRTAPTAEAIHQVLRARGFTVKKRRLEGWSEAKLAPPPGLSDEAQADHYEALARYSSKGVDADVTAMRLAAHDFACERLRPALLRRVNITEPVPIPRLDLYSEGEGDRNFAMVEESAYEVEADFPKVLPIAFAKMLKALQRNSDSYPPQNEAGTSNFHSSLVSIISYFFGGDMFNAKALAAMVNVDPGEADETDLDFWNQLGRINWEDVDRAYLTLPLPVIVAMATLLRGSADGLLRHLGVKTLSESEVDVLCVVFAPPLVCMVGLFYEQICEPGRAVLAPVLSLMGAESEEVYVLPSSAGGRSPSSSSVTAGQ